MQKSPFQSASKKSAHRTGKRRSTNRISGTSGTNSTRSPDTRCEGLTESDERQEETMKGTVLYGPGDVRFEDRETPKIIESTDAILRLAATCVCGSDLWPYRGLQPIDGPTPLGHEYCGVVEEVGSAVKSIKPGQFVVGSFATSDNTCPNCRYGYQSSCVQREWMNKAQAPVLRVPQADGTLVPTPGEPSDDLVPSL